jgi:hypothetical protein
MLTRVNLQNATRTPGDSALFTRVELNEKAITTPTTASAPQVRALNPTIRVRDPPVVTGAATRTYLASG